MNDPIEICEDAKLAVKRGIYWLDENHPGWVAQIDLSELDMSECASCVIGQAVGEYTTIVQAAAGYDDDSRPVGGNAFRDGALWAVEHGFEQPRIGYFEVDGKKGSYGYGVLDTLWAEEVRKRLG